MPTGLGEKLLNDKIQRLRDAPLGTFAYTALNFMVSLLPAASFLIDDAVIARIVKEKLDPKFELMYEAGNDGKAFNELTAVFDQQTGASIEQQARALLMLRAIHTHAQKNWGAKSLREGQLALERDHGIHRRPAAVPSALFLARTKHLGASFREKMRDLHAFLRAHMQRAFQGPTALSPALARRTTPHPAQGHPSVESFLRRRRRA